MKIKILGCGNAFSVLNGNQSFLLEEEFGGTTRRLLVDCGYQIQNSFHKAGITPHDIDDIYISHQHADHIGGLEYMAFTRYDWVSSPRPQNTYQWKFGVPPVLYCEENLMKSLWQTSLKGGLESMEGFTATLSTYFRTEPIESSFTWQGWEMTIIQQIHIVSNNKMSHAYGLMCQKEGHKTVYFTTDTIHNSPKQIDVWYDRADWIFQDCEITPFRSNVHANYIELAGYEEANQVKINRNIKSKMKLSHYQDWYSTNHKLTNPHSPFPFYKTPDDHQATPGENPLYVKFDWDEQADKDGFWGFIKVGDEFDTDLKKHMKIDPGRTAYPEEKE